jgi:glycosyltransferase involved in cell wall biosynthesis
MSGISISIITPCLNRIQYISAAIESAQTQSYPPMEHIVMDGGSQDGTMEVLKRYPHLRLYSQPDKGMYDAINKGIAQAHGDVIGLLNSDDLYAPGALAAVSAAFTQHPDAQAVVGGVETFADTPAGASRINTVPAIAPEEFWYRLIQGHPVMNAWFFRREVFSRFGGFDDRLRWSADRYFLIRIALDGDIRPVPIPQVLYKYRQHSGSVTVTDLDSRDPRYGFVRITTLKEDLFALNEFLVREDLSPEVRRQMRGEHGDRCYRLSVTALYHRQWKVAVEAVGEGLRMNLFWPFIFMQMAAKRLWREVKGSE